MLTVSVGGWCPVLMPLFMLGVSGALGGLGVTAAPPATLLGVAALHVPEHLVEVEAIAVLD
jgi:hypothetical protein